MEPYYYNQMSKAQRTAYHAMKTGLVSLAPSFPVPRLENHELSDIFFRLPGDLLCRGFSLPVFSGFRQCGDDTGIPV